MNIFYDLLYIRNIKSIEGDQKRKMIQSYEAKNKHEINN